MGNAPRNRMLGAALSLSLCLAASPSLAAEQPTQVSPPALDLADRGREMRIFRIESGSGPRLAPNAATRDSISGELSAFGGSGMVAELVGRCERPAALEGLDDGARRLALYNILCSVSTIAGARTGGKKGNVVFLACYRVPSPGSRIPLPDERASAVPERSTMYAAQEDSLFGWNDFVMDYRNEGGGLSLSMANGSPVRLGPISVIGADGFRLRVAVLDAEGSVYLYAVGMARMGSFPGIDQIAERAVRERVDALYAWFLERLDAPAGTEAAAGGGRR